MGNMKLVAPLQIPVLDVDLQACNAVVIVHLHGPTFDALAQFKEME
jgi:uncharacterized Rossmann fold enzyme